jgi:glycosyltransferase involved in cell wall biosynthesis
MRILGLPGGATSCDYYRVEKPLEALTQAGIAETYIPPIENGNRLVRIGEMTEREKKETLDQKSFLEGFMEIRRFERLPNVLDYDLIVLQRQPNEEVYKLIARASKEGIKTVFDIDDDAYNIPPNNPNYLLWGRDARKVARLYLGMKRRGEMPAPWKDLSLDQVIENARKARAGLFLNIRSADLVTTTTPALAAVYSRLRNDVAIVPNQMCLEDWEDLKPIEHPGEIWLGWAGTATHFDDLKLLQGVIPAILERYPQASFVIAGFPKAKELLFDGYADHRVVTFPWTDIKSYKNYLASFDIVLAPSYPCKFNEGKSDIRVLEAGMARRPVVGSSTTYGATIRESKGGFVAKRQMDWVKALGRLIENEALRQAMGQSLGNYVRTCRTYRANVHLWAEAYSNLLEA